MYFAFCFLVWANSCLITVLHISTKPDEVKGKALSGQILSIRRLRPRQPAQALAQPQLRQIQITQPFLWPPSQTIGESSRVSFSFFQWLVSADLLFTVVLNCLFFISFFRSRGRVYGRGRSRSREDDRYSLMLFRLGEFAGHIYCWSQFVRKWSVK